MAVTSASITAPTITVSGTRIFGDGTELSINHDFGDIVQKEAENSYRKIPVIKFSGTVYVYLGTSYTLKPYANIPGAENKFVGHLNRDEDAGKAEIIYTTNGKDPTHTKSKIYRNAIKFTKKNTPNGKVTIKARIYRKGKQSKVTTFSFLIK